MRNNVRKAFTLVEILIVVVILGILAAIVIPQFTNASTEAQSGNIASQLQTIRSQIELFRVRNNGRLPNLDGTTPPFQDLLAGIGNTFGLDDNNSQQPATVKQDPYMRSAPRNPRNSNSAVQTCSGFTTDPAAIASLMNSSDPAVTDGWVYNTDTGGIAAVGWNEATQKWFGQQ